ncbi:ATP-binding protein [Pseudemcibacter aquimaris]|uniref:ATP-binding protein n=1 Tax=Pseudemcibacter aquimaris TaxID=2857064 RepID=UPI0020118052|nr:ATP-binding protein [Pseudemcibacter aquimaris]MCC3859846.1 CHASE domain-containing protein [Pseudemcibacter aquimaris]WDU57178.1 CHASE domain-containing protein [Pseudemcibacter aquimaris]
MFRKFAVLLHKNYALLLLTCVISYVVLAHIGFALSQQSGFAALVWPAAGAALAFVYFYGNRVWPGLFLGALIATTLTSPEIFSDPSLILTKPHYFVISAGSVLQAIFANWLVRKYDCAEHDFSEPKKIGLFYLLIGPVACLTNATLAFLCFFVMGINSFIGLLQEWILWWFADSTSSIIFFTLVMSLLSFDKKRRNIMTMIIGFAFLITLGVFYVGRQWEQERMTLLFTQEVIASTDIFKQMTGTQNVLINNLAGFKSYRPELVRDEFASFSNNNLVFNPSIRSISWVEFIQSSERDDYADYLSSLFEKEVTFWELDENLEIQSSPEYPDGYAVVKFVEPYQEYGNVVGLTLNNDDARMQTMQKAIETNASALTPPIILTSEPDGPKAVTIYQPAFMENGELDGVFAVLIHIESLINEMIAISSPGHMEVSMRDKNAPGAPIFTSIRVLDGYIDRNPISIEVDVFDRTWELVFRRTQNFIDDNKTTQPLFISMAGMIFSALITLGITILSGQRLFLEKQVRKRTADLHKANATRSEFMANMSHDLRTPLNAIIGFSDIMQKQLYGELGNDKYLEYTKDINDSSEYLLSLINDVLDFSAIEANKRNIELTEVYIDEVVEDCLRTITPLAEQKNIFPTIDYSKGMAPIQADIRSIKQIFLNVLSNAVKFTPENGSINVIITESRKGQIIEIIDSGIGISKENFKTILEPFGRVENDPHKPQEGTGLGLSIVVSLVELHGGKFEIDSELGKGTIVRIFFPFKH